MMLTDYVSRKEEGRGLTSIEDSVDESIQRLKDSIQTRGGRLITATRINADNTRTNGTTITRKWCNGYRRRKWTRPHEFKSWTRLIAFHIALIPLGKV